VKWGGEGVGDHGAARQVEVGGQWDEVACWDSYVLGEPSVKVVAGHPELWTDVPAPRSTVLALTARKDGRDEHPVPHDPYADVRAQLLDDPRDLMT